MKKARILILDIETLPNVVTSWGLWVEGALGHENVVKERTILSAAWKWLGDPKVHSKLAKPGSDKALVARLREVLATADAVVAHHGDKFDLPWIHGRILFHGMSPLPPLISIDTKKLAKKHFYLNSNRLDYLGQYLGVGNKIRTDYHLWLDCMKGDQKALKKMLRYNREDVRLLERVYLKLRPFAAAKFNISLAVGKGRECPSCGEDALVSRGYAQTRAKKQNRFQCKACGAWSQKPLKSDVIR